MACYILFECSTCTKSERALQHQRKVLASATYRLLVSNFCSFSETISFFSQLFDLSCCDCRYILFIFFYSVENNLVEMNTSSDDEEASPDLAGLNDHHGKCPVKLPCALP